MDINIRQADYQDMEAVFALVKELAIYEKARHEVTVDADYYKECFENGVFEATVAEKNGSIIGICIYYMTYSTWKGRMLYLEDFVVKEQYRQLGVGQMLFDHFITVAKEKKCLLVKWQVLDWNTPAIKFYEKNGATIEKEWWNGKIIF